EQMVDEGLVVGEHVEELIDLAGGPRHSRRYPHRLHRPDPKAGAAKSEKETILGRLRRSVHKIRAILTRLRGTCRYLAFLVVVVAVFAAPGMSLAADTSNSVLSAPPAVSAGGSHSCGVGGTGLVTCWGDDSSGQTDSGSGRFLAVSAGGEH